MRYIKYSDRQIQEIQNKLQELNDEALKAYEVLGAVMDDIENIGLALDIGELLPENATKIGLKDRLINFLLTLHNKALNN